MIKPLIWKEWQEQRWKLAFGTVMLAFFTGALLAAGVTTDQEIVLVVVFLGGLILSLYSAMGVFAPERAGGTTTFLVSKPIAAWKVFICKWFFGWLNFVIPMLVCGFGLAVVILANPQGGKFGIKFIAKVTLEGLCVTTAFYSMISCFAPRKSSEAFVGFIGLIILFAIFLHLMIIEVTLGLSPNGEYSFIKQMVLFVNPYTWVIFTDYTNSDLNLNILIVEQIILLAITMWVGLRKWQRSV